MDLNDSLMCSGVLIQLFRAHPQWIAPTSVFWALRSLSITVNGLKSAGSRNNVCKFACEWNEHDYSGLVSNGAPGGELDFNL